MPRYRATFLYVTSIMVDADDETEARYIAAETGLRVDKIEKVLEESVVWLPIGNTAPRT